MIASLAFGRQIRLQRYVRHIHGAKSALKDFGRTLIGEADKQQNSRWQAASRIDARLGALISDATIFEQRSASSRQSGI